MGLASMFIWEESYPDHKHLWFNNKYENKYISFQVLFKTILTCLYH